MGLTQAAALVGVWGLSLGTVLLAALPATLADGGRTGWRRLGPSLGGLAVLGLVCLGGWVRLGLVPAGDPAATDRPLLRLVAGMMNWRSRLTGIATGDQAVFVRRQAFTLRGTAGLDFINQNVDFASQPLSTDRLRVGFVRLDAERNSGDVTQVLEAAIRQIPEIVSCHYISGTGTFELQVVSRDLHTFSQFAREVLINLPHVKDLHTSFSLGEVKASGALPLTHLEKHSY